ncbi:Bardet-Biedl syndrome 10 protein homolog [Poecile atricapillus]|uniref:Bardet-Biedl syndrome 10 protein homolog n=1 Tax=Poecile atricapillus TaxID=48891 RepID=UPI002738EDDD|nr:Bardet-Biedl syndrome 10 protein homolog [Poecile atricapillus]
MAAMAAAGPERPRLWQEAAALAGAVRGALGPRGGRALLLRPTGEALPTRDGRRLLEALSVEPPAARVMAARACSHRAATGDGAKSFVVLLAAVLGGLRAAGGGAGLRRALRDFEAHVLERAAARGLRRHLRPAPPGLLEPLLEPYLAGRLGPGERRLLARLCAEMCRRCGPAAAARPQVLRLLGRRFAELHAAVPGLPLASSRILPGVVLRRDFAAYCPTDGELRTLLVTEPLRPALTAPGVEFVVDTEGQYQASLRWIANRIEAVMKRLQSNNVKLLLSSVKQEEVVIYSAKLYGVSVVECLSLEEMALISEITGVSPYAPFSDNMDREIAETAVVTFCQPLLLASKRCVHIGFTSVCAFQPHCLILCGPVDGVNEQHAAALQEAFTMLQQLFKTVDQRGEWKAEGESQSETLDVCTWHSSATQKQLVIENTCNSNQVSECQLKALSDETERKILESDLLVHNQKNHSTLVSVAHNTDTVTVCEGLDVSKGLEKTCCHAVPFKQEESCAGIAQDYSSCLIEAGSVLPVGGYFEILLHYYIQDYAKQCQQAEVIIVSNTVADALLSIPKALYQTAERDGFTKFYLEAINLLRKNQPLPVNDEGLESVYCKYQLVISVLHCVTELLSIDLVIGIRRPLQKIEDRDSEDDS